MSDPIRLSLWFAAHTGAQILPRLAEAVAAVPQEARERGVNQFSVVALDWSEAAILDERTLPGTAVDPAAAIEAMRPFVQDDCACELELQWLLWTYGDSWTQTPQPLRITSFGPAFGGGAARDEGQLAVDFGLDEAFLAESAPWNKETRQRLQANIVQLLVYCRKVQEQLRPARRRLWSEGEGDWTEKLNQRLRMASADAGHGSEALLQ
ncbi:MAG: hypothetical protein ACRD1Y_06170 [Terriglobales bacterium]